MAPDEEDEEELADEDAAEAAVEDEDAPAAASKSNATSFARCSSRCAALSASATMRPNPAEVHTQRQGARWLEEEGVEVEAEEASDAVALALDTSVPLRLWNASVSL